MVQNFLNHFPKQCWMEINFAMSASYKIQIILEFRISSKKSNSKLNYSLIQFTLIAPLKFSENILAKKKTTEKPT